MTKEVKVMVGITEQEAKVIRHACSLVINLEKMGAAKVHPHHYKLVRDKFEEILKDYYKKGELLQDA